MDQYALLLGYFSGINFIMSIVLFQFTPEKEEKISKDGAEKREGVERSSLNGID